MQKTNWKRILAALMAFMLFVADAPAIMADAAGKEPITAEQSVSENDVVVEEILPQMATENTEVEALELLLDETKTVELTDLEQYLLFSFTPEESGQYLFRWTTNNNFWFNWYENPGSSNESASYGGPGVYSCFLEAGITYYFEVDMWNGNSADTFEVVMNRTGRVTKMELVESPAKISFYNGLESPRIDGVRVGLTLDNGEYLESELWDENWYACELSYREKNADGSDITYGDMGGQEVGQYRWEIMCDHIEEKVLIPYEIVAPETAPEITLDESFTGELDNDGLSRFYQFTPEETGDYRLTMLMGDQYVANAYDSEGNCLFQDGVGDIIGVGEYIQVSLEGGKTYYFEMYINTGIEGPFEAVVTRIPVLNKLEMVVGPTQTVYSYLFETLEIWGMTIRLCWDTGETLLVDAYDDNWYAYNLYAEPYTLEGEYADTDENGYIPVGDYEWKISAEGVVGSAYVPFSVVEAKDKATLLQLDEPFTEIWNGQSDINSIYWFTPEETGTYCLDMTYGDSCWVRMYEEYSLMEDLRIYESTPAVIILEAGKTYYFQIHYLESQCDFLFTKCPTIEAMELLQAPSGPFYYGMGGTDANGIIIRATMDDGEIQDINIWTQEWNELGLTLTTKTLAGEEPNYGEYGSLLPGEYIWEITAIGSDAVVQIPFEVGDINDVAVPLTADTLYSVELTPENPEIIFRFTPQESGNYEFCNESGDGCYLGVYDAYDMISDGYYHVGEGEVNAQSLQAGQNYFYKVKMVDGSDGADCQISVSKIAKVVGMTIQQNPKISKFYSGLTYPMPNGLVLSLELENGEQVEVLPWEGEWYRYSCDYEMKTAEGAYPGYDDDGNLLIGDYYYEIFVSGLEETLQVPFTVVSPAELPQMSLDTPIEMELEQENQEAVYQFTVPEDGTYKLSMLNENFCFVKVLNVDGALLYSRGLDSQPIRMSLEAGETYYCIFMKEWLSSSDSFEIVLSRGVVLEEIRSIRSPYRTRFMQGLEMVDIYGLTVCVTLSTGEDVDVEVYSDLWWELGFTESIQTSAGEDISYMESTELPVGNYRWAIGLNGNTILTIPFEVVSPRDMAREITSEGEVWGEITEDNASAIFCYTPDETACYGFRLLTENCYDLCVYGENNSLREGWMLDSTYPRVFELEAGKTYYFTVNQNGSTEFGEFKMQFYSMPRIESAEIVKNPERTTFCYGIERDDMWGLKIRLTYSEDDYLDVDVWDDVWSAYGIICDIKTSTGEGAEWNDAGRLPIGEYRWEITVPGIEDTFMIPFEVVDADSQITKTLTVDADVTDLPGNGNENYYEGPGEWIKISVEEAGTYRVTGTEFFHIECYDENGTFLVGDDGESAVIGFAQEGTYYARVWSTSNINLSMRRMAGMTSLSVEYAAGNGSYYYGFVKDGVPGEDVFVSYTLEDGTSKTVSIYDDAAFNAGIRLHILLADDPDRYVQWDEYRNFPVGEYIVRVADATGRLTDEIPLSIKDRNEIPSLSVNKTLTDLRLVNGTELFLKLNFAEAATYVLKTPFENFDLVVVDKNEELEYLWDFDEWTVTTEGPEVRYVKLIPHDYDASNTVSVSLKSLITAPAVSAITGCEGKAKITWKQVANATGYAVYRKTGSGSYQKIATITGGSTLTYTDKTVKVGTTYSYAVKAVQNGVQSICGSAKSVKIIKEHNYTSTVTKKATKSLNGTITNTCKDCKKVTKTTIYAAKTVKLSKDSYTYDGKAKKPTVTVKDSKGKAVSSKNYTVTYKNNKTVGTATVTITFKNQYSGKVTKTFTIEPKGTTVSKVTAESKGFTVKWKAQKTQTTGYQIQYSLNKNFKSAKTVTVDKNSTVSKKITGLKAKKKYYVRVRTFKKQKVNGKNQTIYSGWSSVKNVTTKK